MASMTLAWGWSPVGAFDLASSSSARCSYCWRTSPSIQCRRAPIDAGGAIFDGLGDRFEGADPGHFLAVPRCKSTTGPACDFASNF